MGYKVFINYRKALSGKDARLLHGVLTREFGRGAVFLDTSELEGGDHWPSKLEREVDASSSMAVLIPAGWADVLNEKGERRLDNPNDFVRFEIARAFMRNIPVLPILIDGAEVPAPAALPTNLIGLTALQAMLLRSESFDDDAGKIGKRLKQLIAAARPRGVPLWAAGGAAASALGLGVAAGLYLIEPPSDNVFRQQAKEARAERDAARAEAATAKRQLQTVQDALERADADKEAAEKALAGAREQAAEAQTKLAAAERRVREAEAALKKGGADVAELEEARAGAARLGADVAAKEREIAALRAEAARLKSVAQLGTTQSEGGEQPKVENFLARGGYEDKAKGLIRTLEGHGYGVTAAAFSPDGKTIVSGSSDNNLKLWDAATGKLIRTLERHAYAVTAAAFSPDGKTVVSGSEGRTLKLWDAADLTAR
ncbi:MAG: hypothetical protein NW215_01845 [Hyphomicrobiales bacterium]|nr:hypothetical protein [Hyphomicrobiales bacterium]